MLLCVSLIFLLVQTKLVSGDTTRDGQFTLVRAWKYLNFTWPDPVTLQTEKAYGRYIPTNIALTGIARHHEWYYLAIPRLKHGVPATLGRIIAGKEMGTSPLISPYPSWRANEIGDCSAFQNVQKIQIVEHKMWIIDNGVVGSMTSTPDRSCPPKLIILDLHDILVNFTYNFPEKVVDASSFLYDFVVDGNFAYITDNNNNRPGIIVFSLEKKMSWKISHSPTMKGVLEDSKVLKVNNISITKHLNIAGITISPRLSSDPNENRLIYFSTLASKHLFVINTLDLQKEENGKKGVEFAGFVSDVGEKFGPSDAMIMSDRGMIYYGVLTNNSIARWNSFGSILDSEKAISVDPKYIQWTNSFLIEEDGQLTAVTSSLQKFLNTQFITFEQNIWLLSVYIGEKSYLHKYNANNTDKKWYTGNVLNCKTIEKPNETNSSAIKLSSPIYFIVFCYLCNFVRLSNICVILY